MDHILHGCNMLCNSLVCHGNGKLVELGVDEVLPRSFRESVKWNKPITGYVLRVRRV